MARCTRYELIAQKYARSQINCAPREVLAVSTARRFMRYLTNVSYQVTMLDSLHIRWEPLTSRGPVVELRYMVMTPPIATVLSVSQKVVSGRHVSSRHVALQFARNRELPKDFQHLLEFEAPLFFCEIHVLATHSLKILLHLSLILSPCSYCHCRYHGEHVVHVAVSVASVRHDCVILCPSSCSHQSRQTQQIC